LQDNEVVFRYYGLSGFEDNEFRRLPVRPSVRTVTLVKGLTIRFVICEAKDCVEVEDGGVGGET